MANITYLFGAGASANCLPTYSDFKQRFEDFYELLKRFCGDSFDCKTLLQLVEKINEEFIFHSTPDTIAKKFFHTSNDELINLKKVLILFLFMNRLKYLFKWY